MQGSVGLFGLWSNAFLLKAYVCWQELKVITLLITVSIIDVWQLIKIFPLFRGHWDWATCFVWYLMLINYTNCLVFSSLMVCPTALCPVNPTVLSVFNADTHVLMTQSYLLSWSSRGVLGPQSLLLLSLDSL